MHRGFSVSLVIPAYNEEATIASVIQEFKNQEALDEIIIVDNNSKDRTAEIARQQGARVVGEAKQGYGHALRAGMDQANGDILILSEADGSFRSEDVNKFLAYIEDAGMVIGTRTVRQMVDQGARMNFVIRMANVLWAKFLQTLWFFANETRFTDVGCTYRALWKKTYQEMRPGLRAAGPEFSPEMMAEALRRKVTIVEIPVRYCRREGGESKHSTNYAHLTKTALKMLGAIVRKKLEGRAIG